jgi:transcriptional regulatory protein LevR
VSKKVPRNSASACTSTIVLRFSQLIGQVKSLAKSMQVGLHLKRRRSGTVGLCWQECFAICRTVKHKKSNKYVWKRSSNKFF